MTASTPIGIWLICGRTIAQGCTCHGHDPTPERVREAIRRLAGNNHPPELQAGR